METKFNSQICTTREQSERLLALGLKKETADMCYQIAYWDCGLLKECSPSLIPHNIIDGDRFIPAWSLHRLWELGNIKYIILESKDEMPQIYEFVIDDIEKQIKEGYFNKEYLCEK